MCCLASFQKDSAFVDSSPRKVPRQISCSAGGDSMLTGPKKGATMYFGVTRERRSQAGCHIYSFEICVKRVVVLFESSSDRFSSTIALSGGYRTFTSANATATQCAACKGGITHLSHVHRRTHVTCLAQLYSLFSTVASLLSQSSPHMPHCVFGSSSKDVPFGLCVVSIKHGLCVFTTSHASSAVWSHSFFIPCLHQVRHWIKSLHEKGALFPHQTEFGPLVIYDFFVIFVVPTLHCDVLRLRNCFAVSEVSRSTRRLESEKAWSKEFLKISVPEPWNLSGTPDRPSDTERVP